MLLANLQNWPLDWSEYLLDELGFAAGQVCIFPLPIFNFDGETSNFKISYRIFITNSLLWN